MDPRESRRNACTLHQYRRLAHDRFIALADGASGRPDHGQRACFRDCGRRVARGPPRRSSTGAPRLRRGVRVEHPPELPLGGREASLLACAAGHTHGASGFFLRRRQSGIRPRSRALYLCDRPALLASYVASHGRAGAFTPSVPAASISVSSRGRLFPSADGCSTALAASLAGKPHGS